MIEKWNYIQRGQTHAMQKKARRRFVKYIRGLQQYVATYPNSHWAERYVAIIMRGKRAVRNG